MSCFGPEQDRYYLHRSQRPPSLPGLLKGFLRRSLQNIRHLIDYCIKVKLFFVTSVCFVLNNLPDKF